MIHVVNCSGAGRLCSITVQHQDVSGVVIALGGLSLVYTYRQRHPFLYHFIILSSTDSEGSWIFKHGLNTGLRCCLHITLKRSKALLTKTVTLTVPVNEP